MKSGLAILAALAVLSLAGCEDKKPAEVAKAAPQKAAAKDGPPLVNGVYVEHGACPGEGCSFSYFWRATAKIALRERPDNAARIVAELSPKELVRAVDSQQYIVPWRGVTTRDVTLYVDNVDSSDTNKAVKKGETVYRLGYMGEGASYFWYRGAVASNSMDDNDFVRWDAGNDNQPAPVWWVRLKRSNGQTGWTRDTDKFACGNERSGDENCRAVVPARFVGETSTFEKEGYEWLEKRKGEAPVHFQEESFAETASISYLYLRDADRGLSLKIPLEGGMSYWKDAKNPDWNELMAIRAPAGPSDR